MEDLSKQLYNAALVGIGAVTILGEKLCELSKVCAEKGGEAVEKSRAYSEELRRRGEAVAAEQKERAREEFVTRLTAQEREELRLRLLELDREEAQERARAAAEEAEKAIDINTEDPKSPDGE